MALFIIVIFLCWVGLLNSSVGFSTYEEKYANIFMSNVFYIYNLLITCSVVFLRHEQKLCILTCLFMLLLCHLYW